MIRHRTIVPVTGEVMCAPGSGRAVFATVTTPREDEKYAPVSGLPIVTVDAWAAVEASAQTHPMRRATQPMRTRVLCLLDKTRMAMRLAVDRGWVNGEAWSSTSCEPSAVVTFRTGIGILSEEWVTSS